MELWKEKKKRWRRRKKKRKLDLKKIESLINKFYNLDKIEQ